MDYQAELDRLAAELQRLQAIPVPSRAQATRMRIVPLQWQALSAAHKLSLVTDVSEEMIGRLETQIGQVVGPIVQIGDAFRAAAAPFARFMTKGNRG